MDYRTVLCEEGSSMITVYGITDAQSTQVLDWEKKEAGR
jgi:hypothetical protein